MMNFYNYMFTIILMLGISVSLSSNNMLMIWIGMEISFMCFMPMMSKSSKIMSHSSIKYFMIQSISSLMLMLGLMLMINSPENSKLMISMSMSVKMAMAPFHWWLISIIEQMNLGLMILLLSLIKIPAINMLCLLKLKIDFICMLSMMVSSTLSINQTSMRKIMAYSSIFNMGMLTSSLNCNQLWICFMMIYTLSLYMILDFMMKVNMNYINQSFINEAPMSMKLNFTINLISMGGMPPMMGFMMKLMIIENLIYMKNYLMMLLIIMFSMIMMFIYLRMSFMMIMFSSILTKWMMNKLNNLTYLYSTINFMALPMLLSIKHMI